MLASNIEIDLSTGQRIPLTELYRERPLALVFLRHLGCAFCKLQVASLRDAVDMNLAFVTLGSVQDTEAFRVRMFSSHTFIADPQKILYKAFGLNRGSLWQMIQPRVIGKGMVATLRGYPNKRSGGDPMQMPGAFVLNRNGKVVWQHTSIDASDIVTEEFLRQGIARAQQSEGHSEQ